MKVGEFVDNTFGCASSLDLRTKHWHDPPVVVLKVLCRITGHRCWNGLASIMDDPEKPRLDVVIYHLTENALFDVPAVVGGDSRYCRQAGQLPGFAA